MRETSSNMTAGAMLFSSGLALGLLFIGLKGLFWVVSDTRTALESNSWVSAPAMVDGATIVNSGTNEAQVSIGYRFRVNERDYTGSQELGNASPAAYRPRSSIQIFYDPEDPARNVLERPAFSYWLVFGIGTVSLIFLVGAAGLGYAIIMDGKPATYEDEVADPEQDELDAAELAAEAEERERVSAVNKRWKSIAARLDIIVIAALIAVWWGAKKLQDHGARGVAFDIAAVAVVVVAIVLPTVYAVRKRKRIARESGGPVSKTR